jgi:hypothetical protein
MNCQNYAADCCTVALIKPKVMNKSSIFVLILGLK